MGKLTIIVEGALDFVEDNKHRNLTFDNIYVFPEKKIYYQKILENLLEI